MKSTAERSSSDSSRNHFSTLTWHSGYPAAQLDVSENEAVDPDKVKPTKKGLSLSTTHMTVEFTVKSRGPTNVGTGKKAAVSANVKSVDDSAKKGTSLSLGNPFSDEVDDQILRPLKHRSWEEGSHGH